MTKYRVSFTLEVEGDASDSNETLVERAIVEIVEEAIHAASYSGKLRDAYFFVVQKGG